MILTESWRTVFPQDVLDVYDFAETRNAAAILKATNPDAMANLVQVLGEFRLTLDMLMTPGGNKSVIAKTLDEEFRVKGWREARFDQDVTTRLTVSPWTASPTQEKMTVIETANAYGGHKVDNVMGRAVVDVEWNPKDGNLDRDFANYVSLYEAGIIDVGVIITRRGDDFRYFVRDLIAEVKAVEVPDEYTAWKRRMSRLADDPLGTSTTANFEKLLTRLERGDARGCPLLAVAITQRTYQEPAVSLEEAVLDLEVPDS
jgi:hypothetical protein